MRILFPMSLRFTTWPPAIIDSPAKLSIFESRGSRFCYVPLFPWYVALMYSGIREDPRRLKSSLTSESLKFPSSPSRRLGLSKGARRGGRESRGGVALSRTAVRKMKREPDDERRRSGRGVRDKAWELKWIPASRRLSRWKIYRTSRFFLRQTIERARCSSLRRAQVDVTEERVPAEIEPTYRAPLVIR